MTRNLVIIGGGTAGPSTAADAKRTNPDLNVTILESGDYVAAAT